MKRGAIFQLVVDVADCEIIEGVADAGGPRQR